MERVLPHVRFPMIKPEQLALLEEDAFVRKYFSSFETYMVNAYKYHAVARDHRLGIVEGTVGPTVHSGFKTYEIDAFNS